MDQNQTDTPWDFIVVGAGSAGCALANRLSADPRHRVLLLEAGPRDRNPWIHIPVGYYKTMYSSLSWGYDTERKRPRRPPSALATGQGSRGFQCDQRLGLYARPARGLRSMATVGQCRLGLGGCPALFQTGRGPERGASDLHGVGGPLKVSDIRDRREICDAFVAAAQEIGLPYNDDFNGPNQEGTGFFQTTSRDGRRCSSAVGYLKPIRGRANLKIETGALATRLTFDGARATGVAYLQNGVEKIARVGGEIVLSGGAINSPQLLQLSGLGPAAVLDDLGIPVVRDMAGVGQDLQDHLQVRSIYKLNRAISVNDDVNNLFRRAWIGIDYALRRRGPLTFSAGHACAFARVLPESETPDVQFHFIPFSAEKPGAGLHPWPGVTSSVCQLRPESRGEVTITSADPRTHPKILANYLSTEYDRRVLIEGLRLSRKISQAPAFARYVSDEVEPGLDKVSDEDLMDHLRAKGGTIFHPTSTCRMGHDDRAVVDDQLRVHGVEGLRIADCSIMPRVVSGNTSAPAIMIGEKCADMMLAATAPSH